MVLDYNVLYIIYLKKTCIVHFSTMRQPVCVQINILVRVFVNGPGG